LDAGSLCKRFLFLFRISGPKTAKFLYNRKTNLILETIMKVTPTSFVTIDYVIRSGENEYFPKTREPEELSFCPWKTPWSG
jgi:hypothetical protein